MLRVSVRYTKGAKEIARHDKAAFDRIQRPVRIMTATAKHIERRMRKGRTATPSPGYSTSNRGHRHYWVSAAYARAAGVPDFLIGDNAAKFASSAAFHQAAGVRNGTFRSTGEMWKGLQVRNVGARGAAAIDFRGSSLGTRVHPGRTKKGRLRKRPPKVRNQVKAGTIWRSMKVNVIQPTDGETSAWLDAVVVWTAEAVHDSLDAEIKTYHPSGNRQLYKRILATTMRR